MPAPPGQPAAWRGPPTQPTTCPVCCAAVPPASLTSPSSRAVRWSKPDRAADPAGSAGSLDLVSRAYWRVGRRCGVSPGGSIRSDQTGQLRRTLGPSRPAGRLDRGTVKRVRRSASCALAARSRLPWMFRQQVRRQASRVLAYSFGKRTRGDWALGAMQRASPPGMAGAADRLRDASGGSSSVGRAAAFQAACREFEPRLPLHSLPRPYEPPPSSAMNTIIKIVLPTTTPNT
jgi:hypothetical protein